MAKAKLYPLCTSILLGQIIWFCFATYEDFSLTSKVSTLILTSSSARELSLLDTLAWLSRVIRWINQRFCTFAPLCSLVYSESAELKSHWSTSLSSSRPSSLLTSKCTGQAKKLMSWKHLPQFMAMKTVRAISRMQQASQQFFGTEKLAGWAYSWEPN